MTLREITIGRSKDCDIYLDPRCQYASSYHATIYYDGTQLMFKDTSTNGTLINNVSVKHRAVPIRHGDIIMLAGKYQINWNQIDAFFPSAPVSQPMGVNVAPAASPAAAPSTYVDTSKFSWAAFLMSGIWGLFNGCWWMLLVNIGYFILAFVPILGIISGIASLITNIFFGINGTRWAWENRTWSSPQAFEQTQSTWNKVAIILFLVGILMSVLGVILFFSTILAAFS
ncbi:MAG: FHA domain-containing protein [Prevotella sp.]|nr:FHA domain-containing protein [Prevotella sp.]